jgi:integrase
MGSFVVDTPNGKGRKYVYAHNQRDCIRALAEARRHYERTGTLTANVTLKDWLDHWVKGLEADKAIRARTLASSYRPKCANISEAIGRHRLDKLTADHVKGFYRGLRDKGAARATIVQHHRILAKAMRDAYQSGRVGRNVMELVPTPKIGKAAKKPQRMTPDEVRKVLEHLHGDRLAARWLFQMTVGCRQSEALGLGWEDVDFDAQTVTIRRKVERVNGLGLVFDEPKSETSTRTLSLPPILLAALKAREERWLTEPRPDLSDRGDLAPESLVFGRPDGLPYDDKADRKAWRELLTRSGVDAKYGTHSARHGLATLAANRGIPVKVLQGILGHADPSMTLGTYAGLDDPAQRAALADLEAAMWSGPDDRP